MPARGSGGRADVAYNRSTGIEPPEVGHVRELLSGEKQTWDGKKYVTTYQPPPPPVPPVIRRRRKG